MLYACAMHGTTSDTDSAPPSTADPPISVAEARMRLQEWRQQEPWPSSKAGRLRKLWPEVERAIASGHSYERIRQWLEQFGIQYKRQTLYDAVARIRRAERARVKAGGGG